MDFNRFWALFPTQSPTTERRERENKGSDGNIIQSEIYLDMGKYTGHHQTVKIYSNDVYFHSSAYDYHISWNFQHCVKYVCTLASFQYAFYLWPFSNKLCILLDGFYARIDFKLGFGEIQSRPRPLSTDGNE